MREGSIKVRCTRWGSNPDQLSGGSIRGPRRVMSGTLGRFRLAHVLYPSGMRNGGGQEAADDCGSTKGQ